MPADNRLLADGLRVLADLPCSDDEKVLLCNAASRIEQLHRLLNRASAWLPEDHSIQAEIAAVLKVQR